MEKEKRFANRDPLMDMPSGQCPVCGEIVWYHQKGVWTFVEGLSPDGRFTAEVQSGNWFPPIDFGDTLDCGDGIVVSGPEIPIHDKCYDNPEATW
jgi:hypothetical protein